MNSHITEVSRQIHKNQNVRWTTVSVKALAKCQRFNKRLILEEGEDYLEYFLTTTQLLGDHLGMSFLQMPENFAPKYLDRLENFLEQILDNFPIALELRHPDWYQDQNVFDRVYELLHTHGVSWVITDVAAEREILHMRLPSSEVFVRFKGYGMTDLTRKRLDEWVSRLKPWIDNGLHTIYFFLHQQDEKYTPVSCHYFINKMNEVCDLDLKLPKLLSQ